MASDDEMEQVDKQVKIVFGTYKGVFNVRIGPKLHQKIHQEALRAGVSLNAFVQNVLKSKVAVG